MVFIKRSISVSWIEARITINFLRQNKQSSCCSVNLMSQTLRNDSDFIAIRLSSLSV